MTPPKSPQQMAEEYSRKVMERFHLGEGARAQIEADFLDGFRAGEERMREMCAVRGGNALRSLDGET